MNANMRDYIDNIYLKSCELQIIELKNVLNGKMDLTEVAERKMLLSVQQTTLSKVVLGKILDARPACNDQLNIIFDILKQLEKSIWICQKARSFLKYAKTNLTTLSFEILSHYRKRELLIDLLETLKAIKKIKLAELEVQNHLDQHNYSEAITVLLESRTYASMFLDYICVQELHKKLTDTITVIEFYLDSELNDMIFNFKITEYAKIQEAFKLLNKSLYAMDQLHINFISAIHTSFNSVIRKYIAHHIDHNQKFLFEQLCEQISLENYVECFLDLCKILWIIIASYNQIVIWHHTFKLYPLDLPNSPDVDISEKLEKGLSRVWNDVLAKVCIFLQNSRVKDLKYDHFIQVLSIVLRLQKIGIQFCGEKSNKLIETIQLQSNSFLDSYRLICLEEVSLFAENESWIAVNSFSNIFEITEFQALNNIWKLTETHIHMVSTSDIFPRRDNELSSVYLQNGESVTNDTFNYFLRFSEKSSPFEGGLDITMLEEDILSGVLDEKLACNNSENSEDGRHERNIVSENNQSIIVNNTTLNILRCIARLMQICQILPYLSTKVLASCMELLDFYGFAVFHLFCKNSHVPINVVYTSKLEKKFQAVSENILKTRKEWPPNIVTLNNQLTNPETLYGLSERINAINSGNSLIYQFSILKSHMSHVLPTTGRKRVDNVLQNDDFMDSLARIVFMCVTSQVMDLQSILDMILKVKWDITQVSFHHNSYVDVMSRNIQNFAMRLEEVLNEGNFPEELLWNCMAHVATYVLVEGYSHIRKCSAAGRALMQLDFANFMSIFELISKKSFPGYRLYVDEFLKSYYLSPDKFEEWIISQKKKELYCLSHLENLVQCVCTSDRRLRQKLLTFLENSL